MAGIQLNPNVKQRPNWFLAPSGRYILDARVYIFHEYPTSTFGCAIGLGPRTVQQDCILNFNTLSGRKVTAIFDGMGGLIDGDRASRIAAQTFQTALISQGYINHINVHEKLQQSIATASSMVEKEVPGGGSTIVAYLIIDHILYVAHLGDSRLTVFRKNADDIYMPFAITCDHSDIQEAYVNNKPIEERKENTLFSCVGLYPLAPQMVDTRMVKLVNNNVQLVNYRGRTHLKFVHRYSQCVKLEKGDIVIAYSDGFLEQEMMIALNEKKRGLDATDLAQTILSYRDRLAYDNMAITVEVIQ